MYLYVFLPPVKNPPRDNHSEKICFIPCWPLLAVWFVMFVSFLFVFFFDLTVVVRWWKWMSESTDRPTNYTSYLLHTSRMIANFIVEGPGNVAKPFVDKSIQSSTGMVGLPIARNLASHWGTME